MTWITFDHVFDGHALVPDIAVQVEDGVITALSDAPHAGPRQPGCLSPGFVDLQVNGGSGVMLNSQPTLAAMDAIAMAHRSFGTAAILPTVITDQPGVLRAAADAALAAKGQRGLLGLHIEGPHIAVARRGTHDAKAVRPLDDATMDIVAQLRTAGVAVMLTLAPEAASPAQIAALADRGAIVSIGHTDATAEAVDTAIAAGASCGTHLFNAMSPMTSRAPGAVGAILDAGLHFGIICDGHHVDDRMLALALRATRRPDRAFAVSDAMATVGGPDHFDLYGQPVRLQEGKLINSEGGLAGAHFTQADAVRRLVQDIELPLAQALGMVLTTPATLIGRPNLADPVGQAWTDMVVIDAAARTVLAPKACPIGGNHVSAAE